MTKLGYMQKNLGSGASCADCGLRLRVIATSRAGEFARRCWRAVLFCTAATTLGCMSQARFLDRPVVWRVADEKDIPEPKELAYYRVATALDAFVMRRTTRLLELRDRELAHNVNALDEVPDSSWFTNRIGVRDVSPEEAALGASAAGPPRLPLVVKSGKPGGMNPGFVAEDATKRRFVVKFDTKENPEMQTAANNICNRIFWTLGYNVPNDTIFRFSRADISVAADATVKDEMGHKEPMKLENLEATLSAAPRYPNGTYRATASEFIDGIPKGGWPKEGVREDDPNDCVPHEHRRELRALRVFAAWLNHTDMKQDNSLDSYVEEGNRHFLKHYLLDFGEALAGHAGESGRNETGYENYWDWQIQPEAAVALGLWVRPWERLEQTPWPSVGNFSAEQFDPEDWKPASPYWPFDEADAADKYWAAKLVMRFSRPMLKAIVKTGKLHRPDAERYLVNVLDERREIIGRRYLEAVTPLDYFEIDAQRLCAVDLSVRYGLVTAGLVEVLDANDDVAYDGLVGEDGSVCIPIHSGDAYQIYRIRIRRRAEEKPVMQVHFRGGPDARILGIVRVEA